MWFLSSVGTSTCTNRTVSISEEGWWANGGGNRQARVVCGSICFLWQSIITCCCYTYNEFPNIMFTSHFWLAGYFTRQWQSHRALYDDTSPLPAVCDQVWLQGIGEWTASYALLNSLLRRGQAFSVVAENVKQKLEIVAEIIKVTTSISRTVDLHA